MDLGYRRIPIPSIGSRTRITHTIRLELVWREKKQALKSS
jgi:hypothetical protein